MVLLRFLSAQKMKKSVQEIGNIDTLADTKNTESVQEEREEQPVGTITRTGRSVIQHVRLVKQCAVSVEDIGYEKLLGLLSGHEYAS